MLEHPNKAKARDVEYAAEKTEGPEAVTVPGQDQDAEKGQE
jgi:F-type H+-transporting ATPase subunit alpha